MMRRLAVAAIAVAFVAIPVTAHAAPSRQIIEGDVLRLESVRDVEAMASMTPGVPVTWDVGVSAARDDGAIDVRLEVAATADAFSAVVSSCADEWSVYGCASGASTLHEAVLADGVVELAQQPSAEVHWYRIAVTLDAGLDGHRADLVLLAAGLGDEVASGGEVGLPPTGTETAGLGLWLAGGAIVTGVVLAAVAARSRGQEVEA